MTQAQETGRRGKVHNGQKQLYGGASPSLPTEYKEGMVGLSTRA